MDNNNMIARPIVAIVGGPNGAGKTTIAPFVVRDLFNISIYVNADIIADGLSGFGPAQVSLAAGRIMLMRITELGNRGEDFAFETTLAGRNFAKFLSRIKASHNYRVHLMYMWLRSAEQAISRVKERVRSGGHDVDEEVIRRRYTRGLQNFFRVYKPLADSWDFLNNAAAHGPRTIAAKTITGHEIVYDVPTWESVKRQVNE